MFFSNHEPSIIRGRSRATTRRRMKNTVELDAIFSLIGDATDGIKRLEKRRDDERRNTPVRLICIHAHTPENRD